LSSSRVGDESAHLLKIDDVRAFKNCIPKASILKVRQINAQGPASFVVQDQDGILVLM